MRARTALLLLLILVALGVFAALNRAVLTALAERQHPGRLHRRAGRPTVASPRSLALVERRTAGSGRTTTE
jgi:hypothetical protein